MIVADQPVDSHDRADYRAQARPPQFSGQQRRRWAAHGRSTVADLRGYYEVTGPYLAGEAATDAAHRQRLGPGQPGRGRRGADWSVTSPDHLDVTTGRRRPRIGQPCVPEPAADSAGLQAQRRADSQPAHRVLRRYRPRALTGNTSRYRW